MTISELPEIKNTCKSTRLVRRLERPILPVTRIANSIGAALLLVMMLLVTLDVILRSLANKAVLGTVVYESIGYMMVVLVFFALAYCQIQKGHVNIDMFINLVHGKARRAIDGLMLLFSAAFFVILTWQSVERAFFLRSTGTMSTALNIPTYPFMFVVAFGTALMVLVLILNFISTILGVSQK